MNCWYLWDSRENKRVDWWTLVGAQLKAQNWITSRVWYDAVHDHQEAFFYSTFSLHLFFFGFVVVVFVVVLGMMIRAETRAGVRRRSRRTLEEDDSARLLTVSNKKRRWNRPRRPEGEGEKGSYASASRGTEEEDDDDGTIRYTCATLSSSFPYSAYSAALLFFFFFFSHSQLNLPHRRLSTKTRWWQSRSRRRRKTTTRAKRKKIHSFFICMLRLIWLDSNEYISIGLQQQQRQSKGLSTLDKTWCRDQVVMYFSPSSYCSLLHQATCLGILFEFHATTSSSSSSSSSKLIG